MNLMLHAILSYAFYIRRTPFLIATGGLFASALLTWRARSAAQRERSQKKLLLIGFDSIAQKILHLMPEPLIGVLTSQPALVPAGIPCLGDEDQIENTLKQYQPTNIVVSMRDWASRIPPALLLNCRLSGLAVEESPAVYERLFSRVCLRAFTTGRFTALLGPARRQPHHRYSVRLHQSDCARSSAGPGSFYGAHRTGRGVILRAGAGV